MTLKTSQTAQIVSTDTLKKPKRALRQSWRRFFMHRMGLSGLIGLLLIVGSVLLAPQLAPYDPLKLNYRSPLAPPSAEFWFGTDDVGRDTFSRVLWGGRETLQTAFFAILIGLVGGGVVGIISGYFGGWTDEIIQRLTEIVLAFPAILLLLSIIAILGASLGAIMLAIGLSSIPLFGRLVRGLALATKQNEYVIASRALGAGHTHILLRHILPGIVPTVIVYTTINAGNAILITSGLSYIGLGAQPPTPEWGAMLNEGRFFMHNGWWLSVFPGLFIMITAISINFLGEGLRAVLNPHQSAL